jgi:hypothetical protein
MKYAIACKIHSTATASLKTPQLRTLVLPITGHAGPQGECPSLTSALDWGWVVNATQRPRYPRERYLVPIVQDAGWSSGPVWTGAENLFPKGSETRTVQSVTSRYIDCATPPHQP